jgi:hypothetical protein
LIERTAVLGVVKAKPRAAVLAVLGPLARCDQD